VHNKFLDPSPPILLSLPHSPYSPPFPTRARIQHISLGNTLQLATHAPARCELSNSNDDRTPTTYERRARHTRPARPRGGVRTGPIAALLSYAASNPGHMIGGMPYLLRVGEVMRCLRSLFIPSVLVWIVPYQIPGPVFPLCSSFSVGFLFLHVCREDTSLSIVRRQDPCRTYRTSRDYELASLFPPLREDAAIASCGGSCRGSNRYLSNVSLSCILHNCPVFLGK